MKGWSQVTRRSGIIAVLAAIGAGYRRGYSQGSPEMRAYLTLNLDPVQRVWTSQIDWEATKALPGSTGSGVVVMKPAPPPVQQGIEVVYGNRVVRLTPEEIMDALEGNAK